MKKFENLTSVSQREEILNTKNRNYKMLWWMQKKRDAIYVQFVNKACMI
jgi:hypothetical protein